MSPPERASSVWVRYGGALACAAAAVAARAITGHFLDATPYFAAYVAVLGSARYFGLGPSILATIVGLAGCTVLSQSTDWSRAAVFVLIAALMIWTLEIFRRARAGAETSARAAKERLSQLERELAQRAEEERTSAQLRAIVESSEDAIISKGLDGIIQTWNQGAERVFGYSAKEAIGQPITILLAPDRLHEESDIIERIRRGGRVKHFETVRMHKDGKRIHVSLTVSPMRDADGAIIGASHIARDITERKEFEDQMRQTQKLESLGVLAGGLAHDFNNLLTGILGNASLAVDSLHEPEEVRSRIEEILQASERAALLIRQMLAYAGKGRFIMERLDMSAQVREILPLLRTSIPKLVDVELHVADNLPSIEADRSQIQQLVMNLALNAAEAVGDHPGLVTVSTSSRVTDSERQVILEVKDTGAGMTEDVKARIFDPFFTTKFTGRGLGLAAVMGIIRAHRGTISVTSAPGKGSTFTVVLPAVAAEADAGTAPHEGEIGGYGLILVADDEELVRNMARFTLDRYGYTTELACDGRDALEKFKARAGEYAAVLLDLTMPAMHGEDVLRAIRAIRRDVPVVLSSGYTESEALLKFEDLDLAGFLQKPYTASALARKIKQAVRRNTPRPV